MTLGSATNTVCIDLKHGGSDAFKIMTQIGPSRWSGARLWTLQYLFWRQRPVACRLLILEETVTEGGTLVDNSVSAIAMQRGESGQTMTEYALIVSAVAIVAIVAYVTLGTTITTLIQKVVACL